MKPLNVRTARDLYDSAHAEISEEVADGMKRLGMKRDEYEAEFQAAQSLLVETWEGPDDVTLTDLVAAAIALDSRLCISFKPRNP